MSEVVLNSRLLLNLRIFGGPDRTAHTQIETLLEFPAPALQGILSWIPKLTNGCFNTFAEPDVQLDRSNSVFVGIQELPPGSPSFRPHPPGSDPNGNQQAVLTDVVGEPVLGC